jgi:uncharacterized repeat protein (TIGR01451 family)
MFVSRRFVPSTVWGKTFAILTLTAGGLVAIAPTHAATVSRSGLMTVTTTAPDSISAGTPFVVSVTVRNNTALPLEQVSGTVSFSRTILQAKSVTTPTAGAVCEKATFRGTSGFAACGNLTLAPGASVVTSVTLVASGITGSFDIGSYGFTVVSDPLARNVFEFTPSVTVSVAADATNLQVNGSASTGSPARGAAYTYTFQVKNTSNATAVNAVFTAVVPVASIVGAISTVGTCTTTGGTATCALGSFAGAASAKITVTAIAPTVAASYTSNGRIVSDNADAQPADNAEDVNVSVR